MNQRKLTYKTLVLITSLLFFSVEVLPSVMVCVMGSSCKMMKAAPSCHHQKSTKTASVKPAMNCCAKAAPEKKSSDKEILSQHNLIWENTVSSDDVFYPVETNFQIQVLQKPPHASPPIFILKKTFLI